MVRTAVPEGFEAAPSILSMLKMIMQYLKKGGTRHYENNNEWKRTDIVSYG